MKLQFLLLCFGLLLTASCKWVADAETDTSGNTQVEIHMPTPLPPDLPPVPGNEKLIAITLDDLPFVGGDEGMTADEERESFAKVLDTLQSYGVPADGFANGGTVDEFEKDLMQDFISRGHQLHNHTYSHLDLNQVEASIFIQDIVDNQRELTPWLSPLKYFRFPYLDRGDTVAKKDQVAAYLWENGYTAAPVTIDSSDWFYNDQYIHAADAAAMATAVADYLENIRVMTETYGQFAQEKAGRNVRHILLLHMNPLNADHLEQVLEYYRANGWSFISLEQALRDPVYREKDNYVGTGMTWLQRIYGNPG